MKSWKGRCVLVTGGTTGIGYEMARCLAGLGADLVVVARSAPRLAEMKKQFEREFGVIVRVIEKDLSQKGAAEEVYRCSKGIPRLINQVCDRGLLACYVFQVKRVDAKIVRRSYQELSGEVLVS